MVDQTPQNELNVKLLIAQLERALDAHQHDEPAIQQLIAHLPPADLARIIQLIPADIRVDVVKIIAPRADPEYLTWLDEAVLEEILEELPPDYLAQFIDQLESDEALEIIEQLDEKAQQKLLAKIPAKDRKLYQDSLNYPEDSAGRLMRRELVAMPSFWTVGQAIDFMRTENPELDLPETFYNILVVGPSHKPVGIIPLSKIIRHQRPILIKNIMDTKVITINANMDQEEVAHIFSKYALVETPVVDNQGRLIGAITVDDIVHVIEDEQEKDFMQMGGVRQDDFYEDTKKTIILRFSWLFVNLLTAFLASMVVDIFSATMEKIIALAVLMPIVAGMGGNASTQTQTVVVRALATKELVSANFLTVLTKEAIVGLSNGFMFAIITGVAVSLWFNDGVLGVIIGVALIINLLFAALAGVLVPIILQKLKQDPAISTTIFITTITDIVGFFSFLGLASIFLMG